MHRKIADLSAARAPFYEPGLEALLEDVQETGRLSFTTDMAAAAGSDVHFICVGTPQKKGENGADMTYVDAATLGFFPTWRRETSWWENRQSLWEQLHGSQA